METVDETVAQSRNDLLIGEVKAGSLEGEGENIVSQENKQTQQQNEEDWEDEEDNQTKMTPSSKRPPNENKISQQQSTTSTK